MAQSLDNKGNVIVDGFSTNLNPTQYASQNTGSTAPIPSAISASNLATPQSQINVAQPNYNVNQYQNTANSSQAYTSSALADEQRIAEQNAQLQRDAMTSANSEIGRLTSSLQGKNSDVYAANTATGATDKLGILNRLNAESLGLGYARETIPLQLQNQVAGQGVTDRGLAPIQTAQLRNNAIQLASNAYQSAIARNDYETAKVKADEMIANKYDGIMAEIEAKKTNLENIKYNLSSAEKKVAEATTARINKEKQAMEEKKANEKGISDLVINASSQGAPQALRDKAAKAKTPLEAANILGEYAGDYLKNEKLRAEISRIAADTREQNLKNAALGVPANVQNKIAANINAGKIFSGQIVSKATGDIPKNISQDKVDGLLALKDLTKKVSDYSALYEQMGGAGLYQGVKSKVLPSSTQSQMDGLRSEIVDLLARARSGAALTAYETEQYENKLPGTFNTTFGLGTQGTEKLKSFSSSLNGTLNTKLNGYGVTFATTPEEDYLDAVEKASSSINTSQSQVSSYTQSLMTP